MLRVQWRYHYSRAEWSKHSDRVSGAHTDSFGAGITAVHAAASSVQPAVSATSTDTNGWIASTDYTPARGGGSCDRDRHAAFAIGIDARIPFAAGGCRLHAVASAEWVRSGGAAVCPRGTIDPAAGTASVVCAWSECERWRARSRATVSCCRARNDLTGVQSAATPARSATCSGNAAGHFSSDRRCSCASPSQSISFQGSQPARQTTCSRAGLGHHHLPSGEARRRSARWDSEAALS
jgi:hypothetical protein